MSTRCEGTLVRVPLWQLGRRRCWRVCL